MSNVTIKLVNNMIEQRNIKNKQLLALQTRKTEETEKEAKLNNLLAQAELEHNTCMRANLTGNASDQKLKESKINLKQSADYLQETKEVIKFISEDITKLNYEIGDLRGDIAVYRENLCSELTKELFDEMPANKKLNEKLATGYAAHCSSNDFDRSWIRFILRCFPQPDDRNMQLAVEKLKASNDFMRD